jgi:hypothetical protein
MEIVEGRRSKQNSNKAKLIFWLIWVMKLEHH